MSKSMNSPQKVNLNASGKVQVPKETGFTRPGKAVKIPQLADYLELEGSLLSSNPSVEVRN